MAGMRLSGWNPCEEFALDGKKRLSIDVTSISRQRRSTAKSISTLEGSENSFEKLRRRTTLARVSRSEVPTVKADFKATLPKLDPVQIRRFRVPRYEAVVIELEEEDFQESAEYIKMLYELEDKMKEMEMGEISLRRASLKGDKNVLQRLADGLKTAESAKRTGNSSVQTATLIKTASYFESEKDLRWFWIAEQLYRTCLRIGEKIRGDYGQMLAVVKYLYGKFLFVKLNDPKEALNYLDEARLASQGKMWNLNKILGIEGETLYKECCVLLHRVLLELSRKSQNEDPELAVEAATQALERAKDISDDSATIEALRELGKSQMAAGDVKIALRTLSKFLAIAKRIPNPEGICDAHTELAFAYKELDDSEGTVKHLELLRESAKRFNLNYRLAQAHYFTGEYLLNRNQPNLATPHLELALEEFVRLGKNEEAIRARCTAGISKGQEVMESYIDLISNCQKGNTESLIKFYNWKCDRIPFWSLDKSQQDLSSGSDTEEANANGKETLTESTESI